MTTSTFHPTKGATPRKQFIRLIVMEAADSFGGLSFTYRQLVDASVAIFKTKKPKGALPENTISHTLTDFLREQPAHIERLQVGLYRMVTTPGQQPTLNLQAPVPSNEVVTPAELRSHMHHMEAGLKSVDEILREVLAEVKAHRAAREVACLHPNWTRSSPGAPAYCLDCNEVFTPSSERT